MTVKPAPQPMIGSNPNMRLAQGRTCEGTMLFEPGCK